MPESLFRINLTDLRFYSKIGVAEQERIVGNEFSVSVSVSYDASLFCQEDIGTTISYADVYDEIKAEISQETLLLETVAVRISERILKRWRNVSDIRISIVKLKPPISGVTGECGIEYFWKKS